MQKTRWSVALAVTALAVLVAASCQPVQVGSRFVKSEKVSNTGTTISVSESESQALQGTKLEVTAGAVASETTITLEVGLTDVVPSGSAAGPVAVWEPSGLKFSKPVKMTLPLKLAAGASDADLSITVVEGDGTRARIARKDLQLDETRTHVSFMVNGFTAFQPTSGARCMSTADCVTGETCVNNLCTAPGGTGGGSAGTGGGNAGTGGGTTMGTQCVVDRDCSSPTQICLNGICSFGGTGGGVAGTGGSSGTGGSTGTGGGTPGTGGGSASCGTCPAGETCWGGQCMLIACDPVRGCPSPLTCVNNSCQ